MKRTGEPGSKYPGFLNLYKFVFIIICLDHHRIQGNRDYFIIYRFLKSLKPCWSRIVTFLSEIILIYDLSLLIIVMFSPVSFYKRFYDLQIFPNLYSLIIYILQFFENHIIHRSLTTVIVFALLLWHVVWDYMY